MSNDEFVESLLFEIKQEIIDNFFSERRRLADEKVYCLELIDNQKKLLQALRHSQGRLRRLLLDDEGLRAFCAFCGAEADSFPPPAAPPTIPPLDCRLRGFTLASRYGSLLVRAYEDMLQQAETCTKGRDRVKAALEAHNQDVEHYRRNYDILTIVAVLNRMSPEEVERRYWLGENFTPTEIGSLAERLNIKPLLLPVELQISRLAPPDIGLARSELRALAKTLCRRQPNEARVQLARYMMS
ncbi:MAG: hypothetical protein V2A77_02945 [Pseudomonadota bacterium]